MKFTAILTIILAVVIVIFISSGITDVVSKYSVKSFEDISSTIPENIIANDNGYFLVSPASTETLIFGKNVSIIIDPSLFVNAGMDISKIPNEMILDDKIIVNTDLIVDGNFSQASALDIFEKLVKNNRDSLYYHPDHDIYEIISNGNGFRWAKNISSNERDIVFLLEPKPFIDAGLNPDELKDWRFTTVELGLDGKMIKDEKLLKIYNIT